MVFLYGVLITEALDQMIKMWWGIIYRMRRDFSGFGPETQNNLSADTLSWLWIDWSYKSREYGTILSFMT